VYYYNRGEYALEGEVVQIPQNGLFVLGDNSASSKDSRYWGFLDNNYLMGKAILIYWPLNRIRMLK
jgi:signal peptidase I